MGRGREVARVLVVSVVLILGVVASLLAFVAEAYRKTATSEMSTCDDLRNPFTGFGIGSAILLLVAQIISTASGGCICFFNYNNFPPLPTNKRMIALLCLPLSWVVFSIAFLMLLVGAIVNGWSTGSQESMYSISIVECYVIGKGVMIGGGVLAIVTVLLSSTFYWAVTHPIPTHFLS